MAFAGESSAAHWPYNGPNFIGLILNAHLEENESRAMAQGGQPMGIRRPLFAAAA